jgi:hypothetical protein
MGDCGLCREPLSNGKTTVTIREKGAKNINEYSKLRNDSLCVEPGQGHCIKIVDESIPI